MTSTTENRSETRPTTSGEHELAELVGNLIEQLSARGETIATAESLTGGMIGGLITSVSGASAIYRGGVISYATELKSTLAGVSQRTLADHGAVSELTAIQMALGVADRCDSTWGIAVTGVAGPEPQEGHQPGTVFVAVARRGRSRSGWDDAGVDSDVCVRQLSLTGDRAAIREQTALAALRQTQQVCVG
jgi:nicotinamide-nucleotide amidase